MKIEHCRRPCALVILLAIICIFCFTSQVDAADRRDPIYTVDKLTHFPLRAPLKMVQELIQNRLRKETRPRIKAQKDPYRKDELKRELRERLRTIQDSYEEFTGESQYDHSLVSGEFLHNVGDAMLRETRGKESTYYFFHRGRIWKLLATVDPYYDFGGSILRLSEQFGTPTILEFRGGSPSSPPSRAMWESDGWVLEIADRRADFGCYTIIRARKKLWDERLSARKPIGGHAINPLIEEVIGGGDDDSGDSSNIVDEILKRKTEEENPQDTERQ